MQKSIRNKQAELTQFINIEKNKQNPDEIKINQAHQHLQASAQLKGGKGGRPPLQFFKNRKKCSDFGGKNVLIVSILGLNLPFKM